MSEINEVKDTMKFDVIIGNPPYQQETNMAEDKFNTAKTSSLYDQFIKQAIDGRAKHVAMIVPARWYNTSTTALNQMKQKLLQGDKIRELLDFPDARDVFEGVRIAGGICYFNWDENYSGECRVTSREGKVQNRYLHEPVMIRDNVAFNIIQKMGYDPANKLYFDSIISKNPFRIISESRVTNNPTEGFVGLKTSYGWGYTPIENIELDYYTSESLKKHKLIMGKLLAGGGDHPTDKEGRMKIISGIYHIGPGESFGSSFLCLGSFDTEVEVNNLESYIKTRFVRFLVYCTLTGLNIGPINFTYVPSQDFTQSWTDEMLYTKYGVTEDEIKYIERVIKEITYVED